MNLEPWALNYHTSIHSRVVCCFWVFSSCAEKIIAAKFFPRPALGSTGLNFFVSFNFYFSPTLLSIHIFSVVIKLYKYVYCVSLFGFVL